ncbi:hypothetical protein [Streptomyces caniferus]|uniref:hypothetical protein n=1 Tax=Streptomyces caniferus TaxID=285557 RepID=UPI0038139BDD
MKPNLTREPLKVSTLPFHHLQLRDGERRAIVCPDCQEWHPLRRGVVWPHRLERTERAKNAAKCPGSARRVVMNIDVESWGQAMAEASASVVGRRSTKVVRKPKAPVAAPVGRLAAVIASQGPTAVSRLAVVLERSRGAVAVHRVACTTCCSGARCAAGGELERRRAETEATWTLAREHQARAEAAEDKRQRRHREQQGRTRRAQWQHQKPTVTWEAPAGTVAPIVGVDVPLEPQDVEAHVRRQAELGKQYARKAPSAA